MADTIRRTKRTGNFTTVRNEYLQDVNLSWKAKGLITYIMSLPPDWQLNLSDLKNRSKDGRDATAAGLRELITNGYCQRCKVRGDGGTFVGCDYEVSDIKEFEPQTENPFMDAPQTENPVAVNPETEKPDTGKPTLINTNLTKDSNTLNTNPSNTPQNAFASLFPDEPKVEEPKEKKRYSAIPTFTKWLNLKTALAWIIPSLKVSLRPRNLKRSIWFITFIRLAIGATKRI